MIWLGSPSSASSSGSGYARPSRGGPPRGVWDRAAISRPPRRMPLPALAGKYPWHLPHAPLHSAHDLPQGATWVPSKRPRPAHQALRLARALANSCGQSSRQLPTGTSSQRARARRRPRRGAPCAVERGPTFPPPARLDAAGSRWAWRWPADSQNARPVDTNSNGQTCAADHTTGQLSRLCKPHTGACVQWRDARGNGGAKTLRSTPPRRVPGPPWHALAGYVRQLRAPLEGPGERPHFTPWRWRPCALRQPRARPSQTRCPSL